MGTVLFNEVLKDSPPEELVKDIPNDSLPSTISSSPVLKFLYSLMSQLDDPMAFVRDLIHCFDERKGALTVAYHLPKLASTFRCVTVVACEMTKGDQPLMTVQTEDKQFYLDMLAQSRSSRLLIFNRLFDVPVNEFPEMFQLLFDHSDRDDRGAILVKYGIPPDITINDVVRYFIESRQSTGLAEFVDNHGYRLECVQLLEQSIKPFYEEIVRSDGTRTVYSTDYKHILKALNLILDDHPDLKPKSVYRRACNHISSTGFLIAELSNKIPGDGPIFLENSRCIIDLLLKKVELIEEEAFKVDYTHYLINQLLRYDHTVICGEYIADQAEMLSFYEERVAAFPSNPHEKRKVETFTLPVYEADCPIVLISDSSVLPKMRSFLTKQNNVIAGLDCEWCPVAEENGASILQIAFSGVEYQDFVKACFKKRKDVPSAQKFVIIIDLVAIMKRASRDFVRFIMESESIFKIVFGFADDVRKLRMRLDDEGLPSPANFVDLYQKSRMSLKDLVKKEMNVELSKWCRLSDWERRPLRPQQIKYAGKHSYSKRIFFTVIATDALVLIDLYEKVQDNQDNPEDKRQRLD